MSENVKIAALLLRVKKAEERIKEWQAVVGPQGPRGETGLPGSRGPTGEQGPQGADGSNGKDGKDGEDGKDGADAPYITNTSLAVDGDLVFHMSDGSEFSVELPDLDKSGDTYISTSGGGGGSGDTLSGWERKDSTNGFESHPKTLWTQIQWVTGESESQYLPGGVTQLVTDTGKIDTTELALGASVKVTPDIVVAPLVDNTVGKIRYRIGGKTWERVLDVYDTQLEEYRSNTMVDSLFIGTELEHGELAVELWFSEECTVRINSLTVQAFQ